MASPTMGSNLLEAYTCLSPEEILLLLGGRLSIEESDDITPTICEEKSCEEHASNCKCADCDNEHALVCFGGRCEFCQEEFDKKYNITPCECPKDCHVGYCLPYSITCECGCRDQSISDTHLCRQCTENCCHEMW